MFDRKGVANSTYAVLTSTALITGLMLLSFSGNPYSLADSVGQQSPNTSINNGAGNLSMPENSSVNASNYLNPGNESRSIKQNQDIVTKLAKGLFEMISGQKLTKADNNTLSNRSGSNLSENQTLEGNKTQNENITSPNKTDSPDLSGNTSVENDTQNISGSPPVNETFNQSEFNQSMQKENSTGFLAGLAKTISNLFNPDSQPSSNQTSLNQTQTPDQNQTSNPKTNDTSSTPTQETGKESKTEENKTQQNNNPESSTQQKLQGINTQLLAALLALIALIAALILFYRSDKNGKEFLKALIGKIKSAVTSIPDLFRRSIVNTVSLIISKINALITLAKKIARKPSITAKNILESIKEKIRLFNNYFNRARQRTVKQNLLLLLKGKEENYEGLDHVWHELKKKLGLENETTMTPAEVRAEAIKQNFPDETVSEIVEAFRKDKYSSQSYTGKIDFSKWDKDLQGDSQ